jgi:hypothetical protein
LVNLLIFQLLFKLLQFLGAIVFCVFCVFIAFSRSIDVSRGEFDALGII